MRIILRGFFFGSLTAALEALWALVWEVTDDEGTSSSRAAQIWLLWTNKSWAHYFYRQRRVNTFHNPMCAWPTYADTDSFPLGLFIWNRGSVTTLHSKVSLLESVDPQLLCFLRFLSLLLICGFPALVLVVCRCSVAMCAALSTPPPPPAQLLLVSCHVNTHTHQPQSQGSR